LRIALSPREEQIVRLAAHGYPNKIIAHELKISPWTVNTHLRRIFTKLQVCSKTAMVVRYLDNCRQGSARF
jgi:DNA-binding NarL/FixJ family response regulator